MLLPSTFGGFTGTVADTLQPSNLTATEARARASQPLENLLQADVTPEQWGWGLDQALTGQAGKLDEVAGGAGADYTGGNGQVAGEALEDGATALREGAEGVLKNANFAQTKFRN